MKKRLDDGKMTVEMSLRLKPLLQSMGQSMHISDTTGCIIYWNRMAELLFGHSASEALGQNVCELLVHFQDADEGNEIVERIIAGEDWTAQFPVRNKAGEAFCIIVTSTALYDDDGSLVGIICISGDADPFRDVFAPSSGKISSKGCSSTRWLRSSSSTVKPGVNTQQPLQDMVASKISNLASRVSNKVPLKMKTNESTLGPEVQSGDSHYFDHREDLSSSRDSTLRRGILLSPFGVPIKDTLERRSLDQPVRDSGRDDGDGMIGTYKKITSKAEAWISKKGISWPWMGSEQAVLVAQTTHDVIPLANRDGEIDFDRQNNSDFNERLGFQVVGNNQLECEAPGCWPPSVVKCTSNKRSSGIRKGDMETCSLDYDILWEDLKIGEKIGQGSCGSVYRGLWCGSDVALKLFSKDGYSDDLLHSYRQEVLLMKRFRHPNVLLFMGAVASPQHLCIVTEFLPCGTQKLDCRRRFLMALDIARGMNYLHLCNPPIVHRDLKSSNLLVDKNWTVKVADFGLSKFKQQTFLSTLTGRGTPQWMAPEVLRNDRSYEKSDIYSYGVVLWEIATQKIPWDNYNSMQVIGAVGFMDQRLDIPKETDLEWVSIIESCWQSDPKH
ncbi:uncharacterized protein LOC113326826 isoform X2 [Papaver somniferum]|uniref:uncharacterized protein LOC113326826 isoform X2 n=1 Tax=Papaver somniferum TaxID=3469 RepID=UPI000E6F8D05|nr:uncharacterized protein LOC113326826 isoform X2 [Papaver somniferum]